MLLKSPTSSARVIRDVSGKIISEIKHICSTEHDSILLDCIEAVNNFNWDTVYLELRKQMPTLLMLLTLLLGGVDKNKYVVCFIGSIILKI